MKKVLDFDIIKMRFEEQKHPRDGDGKFAENGRETEKDKKVNLVRKYSTDPDRDLREMGLGRKKRPKRTKQEYKILSGQAIARFGETKGVGTGFTSNHYVV